VAKNSADSGGVTLLDEPGDSWGPPANRTREARPARPVRAKAEPEDDAEEPFLRARRRVPVRRGLIPAWLRTTWGKLALGLAIIVIPGLLLALIIGVRTFLNHDPRFRIASSGGIQVSGNVQLSTADVVPVFSSDIGRNLFLVPLEKRKAQLEQIPWVRKATVMRIFPNQIRVSIVERTPIAFVLVHGHVELADGDGVILTLTPRQMEARHDSFVVVSGINPGDPLTVRRARMEIYQRFIGELDSTGEHFSSHLSEVDLADPEDVRATVPSSGSDLLLHFGNQDFLARWRNYEAHIAQWEQQYPHLAAIDLRYDREVVLKMAGDPGTNPKASSGASQAPSAPAAAPAKAAVKAPSPSHPPAAAHEHKPEAKHTSKSARTVTKHHPAHSTKHEKSHDSRRSA
jgi:cell division protein FtsQ